MLKVIVLSFVFQFCFIMLRKLLKILVLFSVLNFASSFAQVSHNEGLNLVSDYVKETCPTMVATFNTDEAYQPFFKTQLLSPDLVCSCANKKVIQDSKLNTMANDILKPPKNKQNEEFVRRYMVTRVQQAMFACIGGAIEDRMKNN